MKRNCFNQSSGLTTQYDAFGNLVSSTGSQAGPFGFNGQYGYQTGSDTNLQLLGHRYYDPTTGRFLTRDAIKFGENWYENCDNNPLWEIDFSGWQSSERPWLARKIPIDTTDGDGVLPGGGGYIRIWPGGYGRTFSGTGTPVLDLDPPDAEPLLPPCGSTPFGPPPPWHSYPHYHTWDPDGKGYLVRSKVGRAQIELEASIDGDGVGFAPVSDPALGAGGMGGGSLEGPGSNGEGESNGGTSGSSEGVGGTDGPVPIEGEPFEGPDIPPFLFPE